MRDEVQVHGISERARAVDDLDRAVEEFHFKGFTVLEDAVTPSLIDELREVIDVEHRKQRAELAHLDPDVDRELIRAPIGRHPIFLALATHPTILKFSERVLGSKLKLLQQNAVINAPAEANYQVRWHRDLSYQHFVTSKCLALGALVCVDDFNAQTGGTLFLPGSQKVSAFPSEAYVRAHEVQSVARAGAILFSDAMTFHRAGRNTSPGVRRGVNHLIGRQFLAAQISIPHLLPLGAPRTAYLGFAED